MFGSSRTTHFSKLQSAGLWCFRSQTGSRRLLMKNWFRRNLVILNFIGTWPMSLMNFVRLKIILLQASLLACSKWWPSKKSSPVICIFVGQLKGAALVLLNWFMSFKIFILILIQIYIENVGVIVFSFQFAVHTVTLIWHWPDQARCPRCKLLQHKIAHHVALPSCWQDQKGPKGWGGYELSEVYCCQMHWFSPWTWRDWHWHRLESSGDIRRLRYRIATICNELAFLGSKVVEITMGFNGSFAHNWLAVWTIAIAGCNHLFDKR